MRTSKTVFSPFDRTAEEASRDERFFVRQIVDTRPINVGRLMSEKNPRMKVA